jgi:hypothetical protein
LLTGCGRLWFDPLGDDTSSPGDAIASRCPTSYARVGDSCYRLGPEATWLDGELACEADGVGAHLATIGDADEANRLLATFAINDYWIGMSDRVTEGVYLDVTGEPAPYLPWVPGEPSTDNCGQFDDAGMVHVSDCVSSDEYLCEYDGRPALAGAY